MDETVTGGSIAYRRLPGTHIYPGVNVGRGGGDTLFAKLSVYASNARCDKTSFCLPNRKISEKRIQKL